MSLKSASPTRLVKALQEADNRLSSLIIQYSTANAECAQSASAANHARYQLQVVDARILTIRNTPSNKSGLLRSLFVSPLVREAQDEVAHLLSQRRALQALLADHEGRERKLASAVLAEERARKWRDAIQARLADHDQKKAVQNLRKAAKKQATAEKKAKEKEKRDELRAAAAANHDASRRLAASIRRQLKKAPECPYCGGPLGDLPHCDHIYPVSKGGRSTHRNMVWVCSSCNTDKHDRTLAAFIKTYSLDREAIESRLEALGKDY